MKLLGWLVPWWVRWAALGIGAAVMFGAGFQVESWRWSAADLARVKAEQKQADENRANANNQSGNYEHGREQTRIEYRGRESGIREVYKTVPAPPADCAAPDRVRELLNEAIASANANPGKPR